ncbi:uncharacterized protein J3R85_017144 [Psidium guajava]|nr:uncharacterized protein J3R85_017144 [Psidium guajava]
MQFCGHSCLSRCKLDIQVCLIIKFWLLGFKVQLLFMGFETLPGLYLLPDDQADALKSTNEFGEY